MKLVLKWYIISIILAFLVTTPVYASETKESIVYENIGDRIAIYLDNVKLTNLEESIENLYLIEYLDRLQKKVRITFSFSSGNLQPLMKKINDKAVRKIKLEKNLDTSTYSLTIEAKKKFRYHIITRYTPKGSVLNTAITLLPYHIDPKTIVIDAGHGGIESGAYSKGIYEKDLNLGIAKMVSEGLKKRGYQTYMIRETDSTIDLYERAYIANQLQAGLFISIHHNSFNGKTQGTETLYFPSRTGYGKQLAEEIQTLVSKAIRTQDRGIIPRPGLVVLRKTEMPAVLVEIGYMDHEKELRRLLKKTIQKKAANAIIKAIIKTYSK